MLRTTVSKFQQPMRAHFFHTSARVFYAYPVDKNGKPLNAFMKFTKEKRNEVVSSNPSSKVTEIASKIGALWKELSDTQRQQYRDEAKSALEEFKKTLTK